MNSFKSILPLVLVLATVQDSFAQKKIHKKPQKAKIQCMQAPEPEMVFVNEQASYPGGTENLRKHLSTNLRYPEMAREEGVQGRVELLAEIDVEGKIGKVTVVKGIGAGCNEEAVRVVKSLPNWRPSKFNGRARRSMVRIPVTFRLD